MSAYLWSSRSMWYDKNELFALQDMVFNLMEKNGTMIGQPIEISLYVDNNGSEHRTVAATLSAAIIYYTGVIAHSIKSDTYTIQTPAGVGKFHSLLPFT